MRAAGGRFAAIVTVAMLLAGASVVPVAVAQSGGSTTAADVARQRAHEILS